MTLCDDGNVCTTGEACQAGACVGQDPVQCAAPDGCHDAGACNSANGVCSYPAKPDGTACSSGVCTSGVCSTAPAPATGGLWLALGLVVAARRRAARG